MIDNVCEGLPGWPSGKRLCLPEQETQEIWVQSLGWDDSLEEEMATHSTILAWTEGPGGLQSMETQRVRPE